MQTSALLDIAVTLIALYLLLSLLCTVIGEFLNSILKTRARILDRAIRRLLDDQKVYRLFIDGGMIRSMGTASAGGREEVMPSYVDSKTFTDALLNALSGGQALDVAQIGQRLEALWDGNLKDSLRAVFAASNMSDATLRAGIARWYESAMDRLNGDFVRYMKYLSLAIGMVLALALNADSFRIAGLVAEGKVAINTIETTASGLLAKPDAAAGPACKPNPADPAAERKCLADSAAKLYGKIDVFPVGWEGDELPKVDGLTWLLVKFFGLLITALAISLGSPMLFDLLQAVMSFRGAGAKQDVKK